MVRPILGLRSGDDVYTSTATDSATRNNFARMTCGRVRTTIALTATSRYVPAVQTISYREMLVLDATVFYNGNRQSVFGHKTERPTPISRARLTGATRLQLAEAFHLQI